MLKLDLEACHVDPGHKRQVMVDTDGRGLVLESQAADVQDRDGARVALRLPRRSFPFIATAFADSGYAGGGLARASPIRIEIVKKPPNQVGFAVHPRRFRGRTLLRLDQPKSQALERSKSNSHLSPRLPLRRFRHAPHPTLGQTNMIYGTTHR